MSTSCGSQGTTEEEAVGRHGGPEAGGSWVLALLQVCRCDMGQRASLSSVTV